MKTIIIVFALMFTTLVAAKPLNKFIVFGDSLSDNGNLFKYMDSQFPAPPYLEGHFSNGPLWIERLVDHYYAGKASKHLYDYAYGGAAIMEGDDEGLFTLRFEVEKYLSSHNNKADPNGLYIIWIGANNYLAFPQEIESSVKVVINGIENSIKHLTKAGARHFLILGQPDLGRTPTASEYNVNGLLTELSKRHNELLQQSIMELRKKYTTGRYSQEKEKFQCLFLDVYFPFNEILDQGKYSFPDAKYSFTDREHACMEKVPHPEDAHACDGFVFFDSVHPSTLVHEIIAKNAELLLAESDVQFH